MVARSRTFPLSAASSPSWAPGSFSLRGSSRGRFPRPATWRHWTRGEAVRSRAHGAPPRCACFFLARCTPPLHWSLVRPCMVVVRASPAGLDTHADGVMVAVALPDRRDLKALPARTSHSRGHVPLWPEWSSDGSPGARGTCALRSGTGTKVLGPSQAEAFTHRFFPRFPQHPCGRHVPTVTLAFRQVPRAGARTDDHQSGC
jgi:hypothetical protein